MKLTDALLGEHGAIYALFNHLEEVLPRLESLKEVQLAAAELSAVLVSHARIEEELLFPALEAHIGPAGPLSVMREEHTEIDQSLDDVAKAKARDEAVRRLEYLIEVARDHFAKEERALFNIARQALSGDELEELGDRWADIRRVAVG